MRSPTTITAPGTGAPPDKPKRPRWRSRMRRLAAVAVTALMLATGGALAGTTPATAASHGAGFDIGQGFLGAYVSESDGRQVYCMDVGAPPPWGTTTVPRTVTSLTSHTGQELSAATLAQLNYALSKWGQSPSPHTTAAMAMFVWSIADPVSYQSHGMDGDVYYIGRVPTGDRAQVLANLTAIRAETNANYVTKPSVSVGITMLDQFTGTLAVTVNPAVLAGQVVLTNATFADGTPSKAVGSGSYPIVGKPTAGVPEYQISVSASYGGAGIGARVNLYETPGAQRLLADGTPTGTTAQAATPVIPLNFQPIIGTQVASKFVADGDAFVDLLTVSTVGTGQWILIGGKPVELTATGALYGPFDDQPAEAETVPDGAPIIGSETIALDRSVGEYQSAGTLTATESGIYTWVWQIDKTAQGADGAFIRDSFTDWFGRVTETHVSPFQPEAVSKTDARLAAPGDAGTDTITVTSENGAWLRIDGKPVPVILDGTAYQVPGTLPPTEQAGIPADAVVLERVKVAATGPGTYTSPPVTHPDAGFVTWVWEVNLASQPDEYRDYIAADWADNYGIPVESTSVRWPITITSEVREYNVHSNGRAFDTVTLAGFPENHGEFTGDGYWAADLDLVTHTVYGPFATDTVLTDDLALEEAPVLATMTTPARNGVFKLGYTDADQIRPTAPGYYVIVSDFAGDDRVQPFRSSPADILERFYVPIPPPPSIGATVTTKATAEAFVGEPVEDIAMVTGDVPVGSYLVFRAYGPYPEQPAATDEVEAFFTSERIRVAGPGEYVSGTTTADSAGLVFWVETLHGPDSEVLAEGFIGAPGETTIIHERTSDLMVTTKAVAAVELGDPAHDVAIVAGTIPEGTILGFQAYRQDGDQPVCGVENMVFDTHGQLIAVTDPGEYASAEVVFDQVGTYFWIETLYSPEGEILHRGQCGSDGETTTVSDTPVVPETPDVPVVPTPPTPPRLAQTGVDGWAWGAGLTALILMVTGGTLWFGRRLAQHRERTGYVREEDLIDLDSTTDA